MLSKDNAVFLIIDVQEKITEVMGNKQELLDKLNRLIRGMQILDVPTLITEQYPKGLGPTIDMITTLLPNISATEKRVFSCCGDPNFMERLDATGRGNVIVAGIETHVCVYQTVTQLLEANYQVEVVADAVDSRNSFDKEVALQKMQARGAELTTVEMVLFELQRVAKGDQFKQISQVIK